ncbi:urea ABC transporter permease subunit UrtC [Pseudooceanicola sp. CBS1P-1]|uniref:Urea ABC transporter permease subunit UrtC n=1 Tax=Pseudooceanicola albus TaxID=2692189 RepID=A0A6L7G0G1_9RHOB|nr:MULTISPECIES: urea ABC transporter permease subunit UrtC [Pseudooceanicola]MBT9382427.1 urea ABC transporter permease subunit UrtC [Pseudooceanicola endophyticus]MXN16968.1 urea ABC transporter permease subunit UrtC [Pseudooceanicola albus]
MTKSSPFRHAWILVLIVAVLAPMLVSSYNLNLLGRFLSMAILAVGIVLIWGEAGILTLGQGVFFGLGGYSIAMYLKLSTLPEGSLPDFMEWSGVMALPWFWWPFKSGLLALLAIILVPAVFAGIFAWAMFRRRIAGVYFALITQAVALTFATLLTSQQSTTGGYNGLTGFTEAFGMPLGTDQANRTLYWITLAVLVAVFAGSKWLMATRYGTLLRATRDGENRVRFLGYNTTPYKVVAFMLAAVFASLGGALFTLHAGVVSPAFVGVVPSIEMIVWVAVGGRKSLWGAVAGALIVNFAKDIISSALPEAWLYVLGLIFILVVTYLPNGLAGLVEDLLAKSRRPAAPEGALVEEGK